MSEQVMKFGIVPIFGAQPFHPLLVFCHIAFYHVLEVFVI